MRSFGQSAACACLALMLCLGAAGCGSLFGKGNRSVSPLKIVPRNNHNSLTVPPSADDIVAMMLKVGFSEQQVVELGETLRNALVSSGAAEVRRGKEVGAIFAVYKNDTIFIQTRRGGTYIYDVRNGRFQLGDQAKPAPAQPSPAQPAPAEPTPGAPAGGS